MKPEETGSESVSARSSAWIEHRPSKPVLEVVSSVANVGASGGEAHSLPIVQGRIRRSGAFRVSWSVSAAAAVAAAKRASIATPGSVFLAALRGGSDVDRAGVRSRLYESAVPNADTGCLEWIGTLGHSGHGTWAWGFRETLLAHRAAWLLERGAIPDGMVVRHFVCANKRCINVAHLALGTRTDNAWDTIIDTQVASATSWEHPVRVVLGVVTAKLLLAGREGRQQTAVPGPEKIGCRPLRIPPRFVITVLRSAAGFEAIAHGTSVDVTGSGLDARRALSECMRGVEACLDQEAA